MTEAEWLTAKSTSSLIDHQVCKDRRKLRLLAAACARRMLPALPDDAAFSALVAVAERYADDRAVRPEAVAARKPLRQAMRQLFPRGITEPLKTALVILIALTEDVHEGLTAGIANAVWVSAHPRAVMRTEARVTKGVQADLLRCVFGNPFRPVSFDPRWLTPTVVALAASTYVKYELPSGSIDRDSLAVLADALEEAGCDNAHTLNHLRGSGLHVRGCWALDLARGVP